MNRKHSVNDSKTFHDSIRFTQWMLVMLLLLSGGGDARALGFVSTAPVVVEVVEVPDPVDLDLLADFVDAAYAQHGQAAFSSAVNIHAEIASAALSLAEHHHRLTQRMGPGFEGHYVAHRQPSPKLEYVDFPYFNDRGYAPDAPLKEMVILQVSGEIGYMPVV